MKRRYNWERAYKGSHPRRNLSTPDYQVVRAKKRQDKFRKRIDHSLTGYDARVYELTLKPDASVERQWRNTTNLEIIERFLSVCSDEAYDWILDHPSQHLDRLALREQSRTRMILDAQMRTCTEEE